MDQGSWNGNYLRGEYDYWEVFNPGSLDHAKTGTIGLGEMLHKPQELFTLRQRWQMLTRDSIITLAFTKKNGADTSIVELMNYRDSMLSGGMACFFVLHYHPSILLKSGFTKEYISDTGVSQVGLNKKGLGKGSYDRLYKKIEKIYLTLTAHEFERHQIALQAMGYTRTGKRKFKKEIEVIIDINEKATSRLNKIEFSLTRATAKRTIILSPKVYIEVQGNMGRLVAN